jgi:hypothetical protein
MGKLMFQLNFGDGIVSSIVIFELQQVMTDHAQKRYAAWSSCSLA